MNLYYMEQPPKKWTFEQPELKTWTEAQCQGKVLNLFAGKTRLSVDEYRVDISPEHGPDLVSDAFDFVTSTGMKFDTIILDPPYNLRKSREKYQGRYVGSFTKIKNAIPAILNDNGIVITYGYDTVGMGRNRGFRKEAVLVVCHNGDHNDTLVVLDRKENTLF
jgi:hypothetical protein